MTVVSVERASTSSSLDGRILRVPNAQVQGRPLGAAEANGGGGVPCNAQLGWWQVNGSMRMKPLCVDCRADGPNERKHATSPCANKEVHAWLMAAAEKAARLACACGVFSIGLTTKVSGAGAPKVRRAPTQAMRMPKAWPVLASA